MPVGNNECPDCHCATAKKYTNKKDYRTPLESPLIFNTDFLNIICAVYQILENG